MRHEIAIKNICPKKVAFDLDDGKVSNIIFTGGCPGNLVGMARLGDGMDALRLAKLLSGVPCGTKASSCPNELSRALYKALGKKAPKAKATAKTKAKAKASTEAKTKASTKARASEKIAKHITKAPAAKAQKIAGPAKAMQAKAASKTSQRQAEARAQ
jgi:uncharacterized protein (TIGR03905 family)